MTLCPKVIIRRGLASIYLTQSSCRPIWELLNFLFDAGYLGVDRSDDLVIIQITWNEGRTADQKKGLYKAIVDGLAKAPGIRPEDVFINLVDVRKENWSVGKGEAQYASWKDAYWEGTAGQLGGENREESTMSNINRL